MGFKVFNKENSFAVRKSDAVMSFSISGKLEINAKAKREIGLKESDKVAIAYDDEDPRTFYLFIDPVNGFDLRSNGKAGVCFYSSNVAHVAFSNYLDDRARINAKIICTPMNIDGVKHYPIILPKAE